MWVFACSVNFSLFSGYDAEGYHAPLIPYGYHAEGYHARADTFKPTGYQGYYTRATTIHTNFWVQADYHTCG